LKQNEVKEIAAFNDSIFGLMVPSNRNKVHNAGAFRPWGPGKGTSRHCLDGFALEPNFFPPVSKPMRHLAMIVAHLAVRMAFAGAVN
jgi:hypothetical protein